MSALKPFVIGSLLGAAAVYMSLQYHVVHSNDGFYLVPRAPQVSMGLAYADIRNMSKEDIDALPELARAMSAQEARKLVAKTDNGSSGSGLLIPDTSEMFSEARERMQSSDDWGDLNPAAIPRLQHGSPEAPIWNPFKDESNPLPPIDTDTDSDAIPWPELEDELDPVATQFETGASPFSDITESLTENEPQDMGGFQNAVENVADELDKARDSFASRTRELADQFQERNQEVWSKKPGGKPFDIETEPRHTTNRVQAPVPRPRDSATVTSQDIPLLRGQNQELRNSLNRRAREIYEGARRRASQPIDSLIDRADSRASNVIDELVSPSQSIDAINRAADSNPGRYIRPQR